MESKKPWGIETNTFCMLLHLSQLSGIVLPGAGLVLPIVMWATNKDDFPIVDTHGRNILNWMISLLIYLILSIPLMLIKLGFVTFMLLLALNLVFAVIGAVKASSGEAWVYPLSIKFLK